MVYPFYITRTLAHKRHINNVVLPVYLASFLCLPISIRPIFYIMLGQQQYRTLILLYYDLYKYEKFIIFLHTRARTHKTGWPSHVSARLVIIDQITSLSQNFKGKNSLLSSLISVFVFVCHVCCMILVDILY